VARKPAAKKKAVSTRSKKRTPARSARAAAPVRAKAAPALPYFVHARATVDEGAVIGDRTRVWANAHVMKGAVVGADCNIGEGVFVEGGTKLGNHVTVKNGVQVWTGVTAEDYVFMGPNATFTNDLRPRVAHPVPVEEYAQTYLEHGASVGANATIVAGNRIGRNALIGAGTVVIRPVPAHALVVGNPARQVGWVCECTAKLDPLYVCPKCGRRYRLEDGSKGLVEAG
jgi:UDP-2-acetamido-3-amino-2,3-dideoxy-glucuronate N-acetyltransferase